MIQQFRKLSTLTLLGGSLFLVLYMAETFWATGELVPLEPSFLGRCERVTGLIGPEDLTIHPRTGIAYISAYDRRAEAQGLPVGGAIYAYRPGSKGGLVNLTREFAGELRPHGISLYTEAGRAEGSARAASAKDRLFVVNHARGRHSIEIFAIGRDRLEHLETVRDTAFLSPNDVLAVGPRSFYVANDTGTRPDEWSWYLENLWRFPFSNVVFYDGTGTREVASRIAKASGINWSPDRKSVYVAALMGRRIHVFDREVDTGELSPAGVIKVSTNPDNVEVDEQGTLWIGAHPKLVSLVRHVVFGSDPIPMELGGSKLLDPASLAPSQVVRILKQPEGGYQLKQVYVNDGDEISASSVAARLKGRLLIGSLTDAHILDCDFDPFPTRNFRDDIREN